MAQAAVVGVGFGVDGSFGADGDSNGGVGGGGGFGVGGDAGVGGGAAQSKLVNLAAETASKVFAIIAMSMLSSSTAATVTKANARNQSVKVPLASSWRSAPVHPSASIQL